MANYDTLKATIDAFIRANGVKAITGPVLNGVLRAMVDSLGNGFLFAGEALPNGDPGTPDQNVVRYATQAGTYTNYGGYVHDGKHLVWFVWHGSWNAYPTQVPTDSSLPARVSQLANDAGYITADALAAFYTKAETDALLAGKQATLESGTNIKTINGESILGAGDITIQGGGSEPYFVRGTIDFNTNPPAVTITSGTYAEALAAYNAGTPVYAALTEGNGAANIYPLAQVITPFLVFIGIGADSVLAVGIQSDGTVMVANSALVHPSDLAPVATSGDYDDLDNKPTIPAAQVQSDWNEADNTDPSFIKNKPAIPTVPTISTDIVSDRNSNDKTTSPKATFDGIGKYGVIRQTQTWANNYGSYTISDKVYGLIPQAFIDRWLALVYEWGTFNESTGYFELNGLTDISYREAIDIVNRYNPGQVTDGWRPNSNNQSDYFKARTTIPCIAAPSAHPHLTWNIWIECTHFAYSQTTNFTSLIQYGCRRLRRMLDKIQATAAITLSLWDALEECYISTNNTISAPNSRFLSLASIVYMVDNTTNTGPVTYTFHADAYARCVADTTEYTYNGQTYTGIIAYAAARNITIASA